MIIVTGSGRSGTSIVTKLLSACGEDVDEVKTWTDDARAGMEHPEIVAINKLIFEMVQKHECYGTDWLSPLDVKKVVDITKTVLAHFDKKFDGKIVKDPLFSKTLPVWILAGCNIETVIVCERDPWIAAKSASETGRGFSPVTRYNSNQIAIEFMARQYHLKYIDKKANTRFYYIQYENLAKDFKVVAKNLFGIKDEKIDKILKDNIKMSERK